MPRSLTRQGNSGSSSRNRGSHREDDPFIHPSMEFLLNVSPELQPLPQDRRNSLGMNSGNNSDPCNPHMVGAQWRMRTPHSSTSTESPMDGPSRANSVSNDSLGTNPPTAASDAGDAMNDDQSEVPSERDGLPKITPAVKDGFEPHGANRAVIECIKKYYKKPIISYKEAPLEVREVWFNEFKKKYRWSPEHDAAIRRNFDVKASERLSNALYDVQYEEDQENLHEPNEMEEVDGNSLFEGIDEHINDNNDIDSESELEGSFDDTDQDSEETDETPNQSWKKRRSFKLRHVVCN
nr:putative transposase En/Spm [Ipomoea batatas]